VTAARLGTAAAVLGLAAGVVELTVGASIRPWIGDKQDVVRLGLVTIALALVALVAARSLRTARTAPPGARAAGAAGLLLPGLIGFTTVGRLWWVPGPMLLVAAVLASRALAGRGAAVAAAFERALPRLLVGGLGLVQVALGLTAHGWARVAGMAGGAVVVAVAAAGRRSTVRPAVAAVGLAAAVVPFAALTWWSVVTPLLAVLVLLLWPLSRPEPPLVVPPPALR
jgi:hypothetical protein